MRRTGCFLLACCAAVVGCGVAWAKDDTNIRVMTFNIRTSGADDGSNGWRHRRDMAVGAIHRFSGDFIGIQEAMPDQIAYLSEKLSDYHMLSRSREADPEQGEANPILYRHERWRLDPQQHGTFWLSDTPASPGSITWGNACTRVVTWGLFIEASSGRGVFVYNTHFDHISQPSRIKSAELLAKRLAERIAPEPVIVTGDFNAGESDPPISYLLGKAAGSPITLVDTFRVLHPDEEDVNTFHAFRGGVSGRKIDYIFVLPDAKVSVAEILHENRDGVYPSDHYPVTATFDFPVKAAKAASN